jgi:hypothetical protein
MSASSSPPSKSFAERVLQNEDDWTLKPEILQAIKSEPSVLRVDCIRGASSIHVTADIESEENVYAAHLLGKLKQAGISINKTELSVMHMDRQQHNRMFAVVPVAIPPAPSSALPVAPRILTVECTNPGGCTTHYIDANKIGRIQTTVRGGAFGRGPDYSIYVHTDATNCAAISPPNKQEFDRILAQLKAEWARV